MYTYINVYNSTNNVFKLNLLFLYFQYTLAPYRWTYIYIKPWLVKTSFISQVTENVLIQGSHMLPSESMCIICMLCVCLWHIP